jgi:hypothetical protein
LAEVQVRWPEVPIVFAETRPLAEEWTYRYLGAALADASVRAATSELEGTLAPAGALAPRPPSTADMRAWARRAGIDVPAGGRLRPDVVAAYEAAHLQSPGSDGP